MQASSQTQAIPYRVSPMVLSDRLLSLAEDADRAGLRSAADKLVYLAHEVFESVGNA